jgi:hypothetical protein
MLKFLNKFPAQITDSKTSIIIGIRDNVKRIAYAYDKTTQKGVARQFLGQKVISEILLEDGEARFALEKLLMTIKEV